MSIDNEGDSWAFRDATPSERTPPAADAEQAWRDAWGAALNQPYGIPGDGASVQAGTAVIQAYGDARADAARREGEEKLRFVMVCISIESARWPENDDVQKAIANLQRRIASFKENPK